MKNKIKEIASVGVNVKNTKPGYESGVPTPWVNGCVVLMMDESGKMPNDDLANAVMDIIINKYIKINK